MGPWTIQQINQARDVPFKALLNHIGAYYKRDKDYTPVDSRQQSVRVHVNYGGRDFRFIFTGDKWVNELLPRANSARGGGGAIDFVKHVAGCNFVHAVKICLDAIGAEESK